MIEQKRIVFKVWLTQFTTQQHQCVRAPSPTHVQDITGQNTCWKPTSCSVWLFPDPIIFFRQRIRKRSHFVDDFWSFKKDDYDYDNEFKEHVI